LIATGWSKCVLEINNQRIELHASYLSDALGDLSLAIYNIISGEDYAKAIFTKEPGEYRWVLQRINDRIINLKIIKYHDYCLNLPDEDGILVFEARINLLEFVNAFLEGVEKTIDKYGIKGYKEIWDLYDFPLETIEKIKESGSKKEVMENRGQE